MRSTSPFYPPEIPHPERGAFSPAPPIPVVFESSIPESLSPLAYAAIHLRVPESGVEWLDAMIRRSRKLDHKPFNRKRSN
jgi:hypothetical protein